MMLLTISLFTILDNYISGGAEVPLEMFATFSEIEVKNCKFEIDIFDFFYYDSHLGPMAEMWFRDPETVVEGTCHQQLLLQTE